jgi:predicted regulator of Ras-like GTPase activity (Roadblock/LC7/MglB family)
MKGPVMNKVEKSGTEVLVEILAAMNAEGNFSISVLTDKEGLTIAWASTSGTNPERQSAVVAFVQKAAVQVSKQLGTTEAEEISFSFENGQHFICHPFTIEKIGFVLAIIITTRNQSYRRTIQRAISEIRTMWKQYWKTTPWA